VQAGANGSCTLDGKTLQNGESATFYLTKTAQTFCGAIGITRKCVNGDLTSGALNQNTYAFSSCTVVNIQPIGNFDIQSLIPNTQGLFGTYSILNGSPYMLSGIEMIVDFHNFGSEPTRGSKIQFGTDPATILNTDVKEGSALVLIGSDFSKGGTDPTFVWTAADGTELADNNPHTLLPMFVSDPTIVTAPQADSDSNLNPKTGIAPGSSFTAYWHIKGEPPMTGYQVAVVPRFGPWSASYGSPKLTLPAFQASGTLTAPNVSGDYGTQTARS
jgi:hypothetical protein